MCTDALIDSPVWALTAAGSLEAEGTRAWRNEMYLRVAEDLRMLAREALGSDPGEQQALRWARLLRSAIAAGVSQGGAAYAGQVEALDAAALLPKAADTSAMLNKLGAGDSRPEIVEFLRACAVAALDATDPFGTELVTNTVTSCILHAVVARRDQDPIRQKLGSMSGQRIILDTPVLLALLGPKSTAEPMRKLIAAALANGLNVVAADHSFDEAASSLDFARSAASVDRDVPLGSQESIAFGRLIDNMTVSMFTAAVAEGLYETWADLEQALADLPAKLAGVGVECRPHGNLDETTVAQCRAVLTDVLAIRDKGRGDSNLDHDANTMTMAWRARRRDGVADGWPGAWVVTIDTCLSPAMRRLDPEAKWPLTLTPVQLATLLTRCGDTPMAGELAEATATLFAQEAAEALACRYPPAIAAELAQVLSAAGVATSTDVRVAQTLDAILEGGDASASVSSRVLMHRQVRLNAAHSALALRMNQTFATSRERADKQEAVAAHAVTERGRLEASVGEAQHQNDDLREQLEAARIENRKQRERNSRQLWVAAIVAVHVLVILWCFMAHRDLLIAPTAVAGLLVVTKSSGWVRDGEMGAMRFLLLCSPDVVTVAAWIYSLTKK